MAVLKDDHRSKATKHPKKEMRHAIDNSILRILRYDSHRGRRPVHARGKCAATISLLITVNSACARKPRPRIFPTTSSTRPPPP
jgi:hypothetical protein